FDMQTLCALALSVLAAVAAPSPPIRVHLNASWQLPPLTLEVFEFLKHEDAAYAALDALAAAATPANATPAQEYSHVLRTLHDTRMPKDSLALLDFSLATHFHAPAIQAAFGFYDDVVVHAYSKDDAFDQSCTTWASVRGTQVCRANEIVQALDAPLGFNAERQPAFGEFHKKLSELSDAKANCYVLRYKPRLSSIKQNLVGYGVELAIKSSEYKVIDDRSTGAEDQSLKEQTLRQYGDVSSSFLGVDPEDVRIESISAEEIKEIGIKATGLILASESPVESLLQISQDFPKYAHIIAKKPVDPETRNSLLRNQRSIIQSGANGIFMNGIPIDFADLNPFRFQIHDHTFSMSLTIFESLLNRMRAERKLMKTLNHYLSNENAIKILSSRPSNTQSDSDLGWGPAFDVRDDSVVWWNDLEKDKQYKQFPRSLMDYLQPGFPGQMKYVAKNAFNVLFVLDLTDAIQLEILLTSFHFVERMVPLRFGFVPICESSKTDIRSLAARTFYHINATFGTSVAKQFIVGLHGALTAPNSEHVSSELIEQVYDGTVSGGGWRKIIAEEIPAFESASNLLNRIGVKSSAIFFNGKFVDVDENWQQTMLGIYPQMLRYLQVKVYEGMVKEKQNLYDFFMTLPNVLSRRNPYIFTSDENRLRFINFMSNSRVLNFFTGLDYISERDGAITTTIHVFADFSTRPGLLLARNTVEYLGLSPTTRAAFVHSGLVGVHSEDEVGQRIMHEPSDVSRREQASKEIDEMLEAVEGSQAICDQGIRWCHGSIADREWIIHEEIRVPAGEAVILVNGRVVGPIADPESFTEDDFELLISTESRSRVERVDSALTSVGFSAPEDVVENQKDKWVADAFMNICSLLSTTEQAASDSDAFGVSRQRTTTHWGENYLSFSCGQSKDASLEFSFVIDPLSDFAQKASAFIKACFPGFCQDTDAPRREPMEQIAEFRSIPMEPLLTLGLDGNFAVENNNVLIAVPSSVPRAWVVRAIESIYDLDNLKLDVVTTATVEAHFQLRNILVEGHAREIGSKTPPRGAQFILGISSDVPHIVDTITMTNLGYIQLKANPGVWQMRLREGRSRDVYSLVQVSRRYNAKLKIGENGSVEDSVAKSGYATVVVDSFEGITIFPVVEKRPGMEAVDVLAEPEPSEVKVDTNKKSGGLFASLNSFWKNNEKSASYEEDSTPSPNVTINIFSVASGHLYERFMGIMMLSVMRHTNSPVKFWLIENFLSPKFMNFIPHLAQAYGFEFEFITYNWPHWLRTTTRKERTIWAYKILFLDVLFPLDLDKVIFVDADQVVRTDMKELVELDLQGAVYGYTPMGDSRAEMEGFRFWKTGYWAQHLQGRPYHISALYVIDLKRFRQVLAGDRLRQQYQQLSADPNSLSNLDQDLPNNMIHELPIFSLPKEWLWCETWCSDDELHNAKTIDLCNNPLTKEPKLQRAKRIIKEWVELDNLVQAVADKVNANDEPSKVSVVNGSGSCASDTGNVTQRLASASHDEL
ncbi:hypothetical protein HDU82_001379, partial [Entophlyctis luteolus]